jgi:dienelactone hydrolase
MLRFAALVSAIATALLPDIAAAQERVTFPSLDGETTLVAWLTRPRDDVQSPTGERRPAVVLLHGCAGLRGKSGRVTPLHRAWARTFLGHGYITLMVDSAGSRGFGQTCTESESRRVMLMNRPKDAYAALQYLQAQPFVRADRIGVVGWSQGGATILRSIGAQSRGRPAKLAHDFRAGVAFYPGQCSERLQSRPFLDADRQTWVTAIPLLVLLGEADNWTPPKPCIAFLEDAKTRGSPIELKLYPEARHVFDAPNLSLQERPTFRLPNGTVPIVGTHHEARADALQRVPDFLRKHMLD